jgi:hypothetical protein
VLYNLPWYEVFVVKSNKKDLTAIEYRSAYDMMRPMSEASLIGLIDLGYQGL